jgi:hypothetical protein
MARPLRFVVWARWLRDRTQAGLADARSGADPGSRSLGLLSVSSAQWRAASAISQCGIGPSDRVRELQPGL